MVIACAERVEAVAALAHHGVQLALRIGVVQTGVRGVPCVYAAVMKLPEKQAKRIYARYYLEMTVNEIAEVEGVDPSRVRDSIRRGLK